MRLQTRFVVLALSCVVLLSCAHSGAQDQVSGGLADRAVQEELILGVEAYAKAKGFRFGDGAEYMLRSSAELGARDISQLPRASQDRKKLEAKRNLEKFVDAMIEASKEIPGYSEQHPGVIGEQTFAAARKKLCPLWPICGKPA